MVLVTTLIFLRVRRSVRKRFQVRGPSGLLLVGFGDGGVVEVGSAVEARRI
jgi:hypothetical protein